MLYQQKDVGAIQYYMAVMSYNIGRVLCRHRSNFKGVMCHVKLKLHT
jgi:hypothetical protein